MTPEEATKIYWKLWKKHYKPDWTPGQGYEHPVYLDDYNTGESYMKMYIEFMAKFLPLVTEAAVAKERARCAGICRERGRTVTTAIERVCRLMVTNELNMCSEEIEKGKADDTEA